MTLRTRTIVAMLAVSPAVLGGCYEMPGETHAKAPGNAAPVAVVSNAPVYDAGPRMLTPVDVEDADHGGYIRAHRQTGGAQ